MSMPRPDPLAGYEPGADLEFVETGPYGSNGTVHVISKVADDDSTLRPIQATDLIAWKLGVTSVICGCRVVKHAGGHERSARDIGRFDDARLCRRCYRVLTRLGQTVRAFEHSRPDDPRGHLMGPYCNFCGRRCFLVRVLADGESILLATCPEGMAHDRAHGGEDHTTARNPILEPTPRPTELAARTSATPRET